VASDAVLVSWPCTPEDQRHTPKAQAATATTTITMVLTGMDLLGFGWGRMSGFSNYLLRRKPCTPRGSSSGAYSETKSLDRIALRDVDCQDARLKGFSLTRTAFSGCFAGGSMGGFLGRVPGG
jgi:hypothetical protein